jgi:hypothetical protein
MSGARNVYDSGADLVRDCEGGEACECLTYEEHLSRCGVCAVAELRAAEGEAALRRVEVRL